MIISEEKTCRHCHRARSISDFSKDHTRGDGLHPYCRICRNEAKRKRHHFRYHNDSEYREKLKLRDRLRWNGKRRENCLKKWANRTSDQKKDAVIKCIYGISMADFYRILKEQNGVCAICCNYETRKDKYTGKPCRLHIDHDHQTRKVRGLLCMKCNNGIANFRENLEFLDNAKEYLIKHKEV